MTGARFVVDVSGSGRRAPGRGAPYPVSDRTTLEELVMSWLVLAASGVLEAVWATALARSEGFSKLGYSLLFVVSVAASMSGLAYALRSLPTGTAYAVWVGIGAVTTVGYGMAAGDEPVTAVKILLLAG